MRANMKLYTATSAQWKELLPVIKVYLDEFLNFTDSKIKPVGAMASPVGLEVTLPVSLVERIVDILSLTNISGKIVIAVEYIKPQDDPKEQEILSKLYTAGDTSMKPPEPKDRESLTHYSVIHKHKAQ